jgi:hypothetical protein
MLLNELQRQEKEIQEQKRELDALKSFIKMVLTNDMRHRQRVPPVSAAHELNRWRADVLSCELQPRRLGNGFPHVITVLNQVVGPDVILSDARGFLYVAIALGPSRWQKAQRSAKLAAAYQRYQRPLCPDITVLLKL